MSILKKLRTPAFHAEGFPRIDLSTWTLSAHGMVRCPSTFGLADLRALPTTSAEARLTSVSGWSVKAIWDGVLVTEMFRVVEPTQHASHATFSSVGGYQSTLGIDNLSRPKVMLCYGIEGEPLDPEYGGPVRLLVPHLWGYKSVKWLASIELTDTMRGGYWEDRGYLREAEIEPGVTFDINTRTKRPIKGGSEVTEF